MVGRSEREVKERPPASFLTPAEDVRRHLRVKLFLVTLALISVGITALTLQEPLWNFGWNYCRTVCLGMSIVLLKAAHKIR